MKHTKTYFKIILLLLSLLLSACFGSPGSVPEDRFYKIKIAAPEVVASKYKRITIKKVYAYGLYNERAILYSKAEMPLQIKRYHYHHWVMPPTQIIQHGLKEYLIQSRIAKTVIEQAVSRGRGLQISAELLAFERIIRQSEQLAHVKLEFEVKYPDGRYRSYQYSRKVKAGRNTLHATAEAYGVALASIFRQLLGEL